ncbi:hypothetical protein [Rodentibacter trehalosifermentans]|uniref:hypothetical protein n=1 Tax=Rodentibacter trehalosifermentans TaxID=1908263 RepID=UPI0009878292|nr:hypothetical protein [Rodentibacter trehalosifermentans]OOF47608.1 hypothetical protein BKK53_11100 [Rodentibacter trehalosifermentans]
MAQKLSKHELVERLLLLKEKQALLAKQVDTLTQEIDELTLPFMPKPPKDPPLFTMPLVAKVLREYGDWMMCGEIAEAVLKLQGQPQFVDVGDKYYKIVKRMLRRLAKKGLVQCGGIHWRLKSLKPK